MGIRGLTSLINKYVPDAIKIRSMNYFKGSVIAIDTSILLYKFKYSNDNPNSHINGFLNKCLSYVRHGIIPIFILDGKPPPEKNITLNKRFRHKKKIEDKIRTLELRLGTQNYENKEELIHKIKKLNKQIISVTKEHRQESRDLLLYLGFCVINSPCEAETLCAYLQKNDIVNFTYSDDTDLLPLGCKKILRSSAKHDFFMEIDLDTILRGLGLTIDEFVDMCILCGCDYCIAIPKLSYDRAYELIRQYKSIENIISSGEIELPSNFNYDIARQIFKINISNSDLESFSPNKYHYELGTPWVNPLLTEGPEGTLRDSDGARSELGTPWVNGACSELDKNKLYDFLIKKRFTKRYIERYINNFNLAKKLNIEQNKN